MPFSDQNKDLNRAPFYTFVFVSVSATYRANLPEPPSGVQPDPEAAAAGRGLQPD